MPLSSSLASPAAYPLTLTLLHFLWQGALVAAVTWILLRAIPWRTPRLRYTILLCALVAQSLAPAIPIES